MKKLFALAFAIVMVASCGTKNQKQETIEKFDVANVFEKIDHLVGKTIAVEGTVAHVCKHGGDKMFLVGNEGQNRLKIEPTGDLQSFSPEIEGLTVVVTGVLEEMRIDEEYLKKWESEIAGEEDDHGHDHSTCKNEADQGEHTSAMHKIAKYRKKLASSEKGYLSLYTLKATKVDKVATEVPVETEVTEGTDSEQKN